MAVAIKTSKPHLIEYLPAIYQEADPSQPVIDPSQPTFLYQFLLAFEEVLLGLKETGGVKIEGLGEKITRLYKLFDPGETPDEFLPWLAGWAALSLHSGLSPARKRNLLAHIIPLYRIRGTRKYIEELLKYCVDAVASVSDAELPLMQVGIHSTVGSDTYLDGGPPYFFQVMLTAAGLNEDEFEAQSQIALDVIELAKPAHTCYEINVVSPELQLGVRSTVGIDTILGDAAA
jgi:phage tail-like protein